MISDEIKSLRFESWWVENGQKNQISIIFRLDGNPHEVIIKDTKYYVKELYSSDKRNTNQITVSLYSNHPPTHPLCSAGICTSVSVWTFLEKAPC